MKDKLVYSGKAKNLYSTDNDDELLMVYKDQATSLNGKNKKTIEGKGLLNFQITNIIFDYLQTNGIKTHFISNLDDKSQIVHKTEVIPLELVVRNKIAGSFAKKFNLQRGLKLKYPVIEFYYKNDELDDPFINDSQIFAIDLMSNEEMSFLKNEALKINDLLMPYFDSKNLDLIDFKLEFGRFENSIILVDEFSPDNCRLWDKSTGDSLDKDVFRNSTGSLIDSYKEVLKRLVEY
ncbi:phosphoribosylaminoimidazolesuccinocarboxamide synthase [Companilactobacillus metriopterae]|uniref:phosphoribosylaminoimidazolesuccinocarboxamide synthase n=1 Tax=Companilactobacillus metriopterae TaxID=1909267 RepID=UPI00100BE9FC|nr:phosphoribosylaminoimidazolesuccinocarboxamide synthase [Companilactobacillus metriopterae]